MRSKNHGRRFAASFLAVAMGCAVPAVLPLNAVAQDDPRDVREDKVPPAVLATARKQILDGRDVVYRKQDNTFFVNFTTPTNLRLQTRVHEDGALVRAAELAPNQPEDGPKRAERDRLFLEWTQRVAAAQAVPAQPPPVVQPGIPQPPVGQPPLPGQPPIPVPTVATPITAAQLPGPVLASLDRFTAGGREVSYQQLREGDAMRYEARYTHADGSRREVVVNNGGNLIAGPMVITDQATDQQLQADRPDIGEPKRITPIAVADVPATAMTSINRFVPKDAVDVRYRRDIYANGTSLVGVHWIVPQNGKRYWMAVNDNGNVQSPPRLSSFQPTPTDQEGVRSVRMNREAVPERVRAALDAAAVRGRDAVYFQQIRDGKTYYGIEWTAADNRRMWLRTDADGKTVAGPVLAESGTKVPPIPDNNVPELPGPVQTAIARRTQGGKNIETVRRTEGGRIVYFTSWVDAQGDKHQMRLDEKGQPIVQERR